MPKFPITNPPMSDPRDRILSTTKPPSPDRDIRKILTQRKMLLPLGRASPSLQRPARKELPLTGWLTEVAVASAIGCSLSLLRQNRHFHRGIPYTKMGRSVRYAAEDVKKYMQERRIVPQ